MNMTNHEQLLRLVAIMRGLPPEQALKSAEVLAEAGIRAIEVTFNTQGAADIIKALRKTYGDDMLIGAGTVINTDQLACAVDAGASFILAPDCNPEVIRGTKEAGLFAIPGAMTPTEILTAVRAGADMVKLFPAGSLGTGYLKNILGPLDDVKIMVVGRHRYGATWRTSSRPAQRPRVSAPAS